MFMRFLYFINIYFRQAYNVYPSLSTVVCRLILIKSFVSIQLNLTFQLKQLHRQISLLINPYDHKPDS
jgi:hypothetical protein